VQHGLDITQLAAAPLLSANQTVLGVLEVAYVAQQRVVEPVEGALLREVADVAAIALQNAERLDAEHRATDLGSLLEVVQELGSSLDLQKIMVTLVHKAATVLDYSRAAVGLQRGSSVELSAVSGQAFVDLTLPEAKSLARLMEWLAGLDEGLYVVREDDGSIDTSRPETREKFRAFFEATGARSFLAVPLRDEQGALGVFTLESSQPYAFDERQMEMAGLLAAQAAVAIRNATLYKQIPMMRVFRPLSRWKERADGLAQGRGWVKPALAIAVLLALVLIPFPLRVAGQARVLALQRWPISASADGRVAQVLVREGDRVEAGQTIARLDDSDARMRFLDASARVDAARRELSRARAGGNTGDAAVIEAQLAGLEADLVLGTERLEQTRLKAPVSGVVLTPRIEERAGARVALGEVFCELADPNALRIEIAVPEVDAGLVDPEMTAKIKLNAFATQSFSGTVDRVGVAAVDEDGQRVFLVSTRLDEAATDLRPGMTGRAKITTRRASLARVIFRRPARWIWNALWSWLP
jgi:GAF domain-containing protein/biotin carboxyl carrier protein